MELSETKVRWYVNDQLMKNEENGLGIKFLKFTVPDYGGGETEVRIALPEQALDYILHIPVNSPEAVIRNGSAGTSVQAGNNSFEAIPFFFNTPSLDNIIFDWTANGQKTEGASDNPQMLNLNIDSQAPSGFQIDLRVTLRNFLNQLEIAARNIQLRVK
ncbi:hypothetical protein HYV91_01280 [Candidatus Wolfebacteria bacterium]|nr:hypothetical protein [Candidatus Wolfebacteria bacterium]